MLSLLYLSTRKMTWDADCLCLVSNEIFIGNYTKCEGQMTQIEEKEIVFSVDFSATCLQIFLAKLNDKASQGH